MKRVYLDQWVWIRLARAALGRAEHSKDEDVLAVVRESVRLGLASYPLCPTHYMELTACASPKQRQELAPIISEISRYHTMIGPGNEVIAAELDMYLKRLYGRPVNVRAVQVFGQGIGHAFGDPASYRMRLVPKDRDNPAPIDPGARLLAEDRAQWMAEYYMIAGPAPNETVPGYQTKMHTVHDQQFADGETEYAQRLRTIPRAKLSNAIYARALAQDVLPLAREALQHAALPERVMPWSDMSESLNMLKSLPTLWAVTELKRLQHENTQRPWQPQDHSDLMALSMAIVHCDVVVVDKHWSAMARRAKLDEANGTVLSSFYDLPRFLVAS